MTTCDRFEREGLIERERGLLPPELAAHLEHCPDCSQARAAYERLEQEIATLGTAATPPPHWQSRVWAQIEDRQDQRRRRWWRAGLWLPATALAALFAVFVVVPALVGPAPVALEVAVAASDATVRRGLEAQPGDRLLLNATVGRASVAELRVYHHDRELVLRCSTSPPCERRGRTLEATLVLATRGTYQSVVLTSEAPLPDPAGVLDADAQAALATGAQVTPGREVEVR